MSLANVSRDVELEEDTELFVGPPPPALVTEVESANEAERFEEVLPSFSSLSYQSISCIYVYFPLIIIPGSKSFLVPSI